MRSQQQNPTSIVAAAAATAVDDDQDSSGRFSQSGGSAVSDTDTSPIVIRPAVVDVQSAEPLAAIITYWKSPHEFYYQPKHTHDTYVQMMKQLQVDYAKRQPDASLAQSGRVGTFVVCRNGQSFSRAQIVAGVGAAGSEPAVQFCDNGDRAELRADNVWSLDRRYAQWPRFAVCCAIPDVVQVLDKQQIAFQVKRYIGTGQAVATQLLGQQQQHDASSSASAQLLYWADVQHDGKSLREALIADGMLAALPPSIDLAHLVGQTLVVDVRQQPTPTRLVGAVFGCRQAEALVFETAQPVAEGTAHFTALVTALSADKM